MTIGITLELPVLLICVGIGFGDYTFAPIIKAPIITGFPQRDYSLGLHNTFLIFAVGSGIPALVFLVWTLAGIVRALIRRFRTNGDKREQEFAIGLATAVVGFAVQNCFAPTFVGSLAYLFWILVATGLAVETKADK